MPGPWLRFHKHDKLGKPVQACSGTLRWRYHENGLIEVEGRGFPTMPWPEGVDKWLPLIEQAAAKHGVPAVYVASTMAQETGGRNVCLNANPPPTVCGAPCQCVQNEGAGVMAMQPSTATLLAGRSVSSQELLNDPALAIDLGAKLIRHNLDRHGGDFMHAAMSYNAGSVRCGRGATFVPAGKDWPKEPCPDTGWGVVMGCVYTSQKYGERCVPSKTGVQPYVCSTDYPTRAAEAQNAARVRLEGATLPGGGAPPPPPPTTEPPLVAGLSGGQQLAYVVAGAIAGYAALSLWA